ncbi:hypothetical protein [Micromonospora halophytica]|uniref:Uncharacterized protein n=1 Tax=Micromonospora halophytica TaxID=47864 RepID=A0A1C5JQD4_9ACTN|nr:hypothetical protein [Micromonospora halophytica]SCG72216.1 hypothetical protein GA0070560_1574 [Micromonospora halophytica]
MISVLGRAKPCAHWRYPYASKKQEKDYVTRSDKRVPRLFRAAAPLAALLVGAMLANPAPASAKPLNPTVKATVWAHSPTTAEYRISGGYTAVTGGGDVLVRRTGVGAYRVTLENAARTVGGVAHVVAYGSDPVFCTVAASYPSWSKWDPTVGDHVIQVRCFDATGAPADNRFVATYTNVRSADQARLLYFTTDQAAPTGVRTIPSSLSYDSTGAPITYERISTGRYKVNWGPNPSGLPVVPTVLWHVSTFASTAVHCQPVNEEVWCADGATGMLTDSRFTMTLGRVTDLVGNVTGPRFSASNFTGTTYDGNRMWLHSYNTAVSNYGWNTVDGLLLGTGRYQLTIEQMATPYGTAFVSAAAASDSPRGYCTVAGWGASGLDERVFVNCYGYGGAPANLNVNMSFTTWPAA